MSDSSLEAAARATFGPNGGARLAPFFLALPIAFALEAVAIIQVFKWWQRYWHKDNWWIKGLAIWVALFGLAFTVTQTARTFDIFVRHFGQYSILYDQRAGRWLLFFMCGTHMGSEAFYVYRVFVLSNKNRAVLTIFAALWVALLTVSIVGVARWPLTTLGFDQSTLIVYAVQGALTGAFDTVVTLTILWLLYKRRRQSSNMSGESRGNKLIKRLMRLSVETQMPVSFFAIALSIADGVHEVWIWVTPICIACLCLISQITLFMVLNARRRLEQEVGVLSESGARAPSPEPGCESGASGALSINKLRVRAPEPDAPWLLKSAPGQVQESYENKSSEEDSRKWTSTV